MSPPWRGHGFSRESINHEGAGQMVKRKDVRHYVEGPVTELAYIRVEYGHFEEYVDWLTSTWKPTMEAMKTAGLVIAYKVVKATPKTPHEPTIILMITFKDWAHALDKVVAQEEIAKSVIGTTAFQNKARATRNQYRTLLGIEYVREIILQ